VAESTEVTPLSLSLQEFVINDNPPGVANSEVSEYYLSADGLELGLLHWTISEDPETGQQNGWIDGIDVEQYYPQWDDEADRRRKGQRAEESEETRELIAKLDWLAVAGFMRQEFQVDDVIVSETATPQI
jgi:hypothetical protein